ncbi:MAG: DUF4129 domain-containing protein [Pyrinomonadaceae bacterium]
MKPLKRKKGNERIRLLVMQLLVSFMFVTQAFGIGLADYLSKLEAARSDVDVLIADVENTRTGKRNLVRSEAVILRIRETLPPGLKIDVPGGIIESDTQWLIAELDDLESRVNLSEKTAVLVGIKERLDSIADRLDELNQAAASERSKDEDKQKLAEILRREEYQMPEPPKESLIERWLRELMEWLRNAFPSPDISPTSGSGGSSISFVLQILLYGGLAVAIGFLIYRFVPFLANRRGRRSKNKKADRVILGERIAANASAHDLFTEADDLARTGELRLAIRKGYIALLCELSDRKLIGLARHKTNRDYLRDVRKRPRLFENMTGMTRTFEQHWYGLKQIEANEWEDFRATYQRAVNDTGKQ